MFRKSRKSVVTVSSNAPSAPQSPRFFQTNSCGLADAEGAAAAAASFSIGEAVKPKSPGFLSRLFKRSKEDELKSPVTTVTINGSNSQNRRKSLWQRSKSILRPRSILDRSESAVLDLPKTQLNIRGSGSVAELLMNEFPIEEFYAKGSAVDTDGLLMKIFEANQVMYEQLKKQERQKDAARMAGQTAVNNFTAFNAKPLNLDGLITPVLTATELEACEQAEAIDAAVADNFAVSAEKITAATAATVLTEAATDVDETVNVSTETEALRNENVNLTTDTESGTFEHRHFADNPQLDSPLYRNASESFSVSSDSDSVSASASSLSLGSFDDINVSLDGVDSMSLAEMAVMFDCLTVNDPETLMDGTVRCVYETDNGSQESIHFHNWKQELAPKPVETDSANSLRSTKSEENLKFTEISVAAESKLTLKQRSMSLAAFSKVESQVPVDRRRSLGAKVSQIVAMFEGAAHF